VPPEACIGPPIAADAETDGSAGLGLTTADELEMREELKPDADDEAAEERPVPLTALAGTVLPFTTLLGAALLFTALLGTALLLGGTVSVLLAKLLEALPDAAAELALPEALADTADEPALAEAEAGWLVRLADAAVEDAETDGGARTVAGTEGEEVSLGTGDEKLPDMDSSLKSGEYWV